MTGAPAIATTFDYAGAPYQYNTDPADYGTNLTGFVTFSCNPCSDGTYYFTNATITAYDFISGSLSITKTTDVNAADSYIILSGGSVSQWDINVIDYPNPGNFSDYNNIETEYLNGGGSNDLYAVSINNSLVAVGGNTGDPGNWNPTPLPAALPLFGSGLAALGILTWRRKRKRT